MISTIYYWLLKLIINSALENIGIFALFLLLRDRIEILAKFWNYSVKYACQNFVFNQVNRIKYI